MQKMGLRIQVLRRNKNMTQAQLAEVLSVSPQTVSKWENGMSLPDVSLLPIIARYFGITMDELFGYRLDALNYRERFIRFMADNSVLQFGAFRLQSGRVSPYYINTGNYRSAGQISRLGEFYAECMRENNVEANLLAANTRREIPIMLASSFVLYNRYGIDMNYTIDNMVGKHPDANDRITLIKDTLTSGKSLRDSLQAIEREAGRRVTDVIVSVDRMERQDGSFMTARRETEEACGVRIHAIVTLEDIINALEKGIIAGAEYLSDIRRYKETYGGNIHGD